jgi:hypothetical protein
VAGRADLKRITKKRGKLAKKIRHLRNKGERLLRESERIHMLLADRVG